MDAGRCKKCDDIQGCIPGYCTHDDGCQQCQIGYYQNGKECGNCKHTLAGCKSCNDARTCTSCVGDFLTIDLDTNKCACTGESPHMIRNSQGSCECEDGYWLTETGCKTCDQLITGCDKCYRTSIDTGIPLYNGATLSRFTQRQYYVDCQTCEYGTYKIRTNQWTGTSPSCPTCDSKFSGCADCGTLGTYCNKCLNTHVY